MLTGAGASLYSPSQARIGLRTTHGNDVMTKIAQPPTPYPEINVLLYHLLTDAKEVLGEQFVGMYLYGSLASGDFDVASSDVDFVVVTEEEVGEEAIAKLRTLHERLWAGEGLGLGSKKWAAKLEGTYIGRAALRRYEEDERPHPQVNEGQFYVAPHGSDWVIQRHILREQGVVVAGPPIQRMIDRVTPDELRGAVAGVLLGWWSGILADPEQLRRTGYQPYAVLTMCRALYCFEKGEIVSKRAAAQWAMKALEARWKPLVRRALEQEADLSEEGLAETRALIRVATERAKD